MPIYYTLEQVKQLAEQKVKEIIDNEIKPSAEIGILNLDRQIIFGTNNDYDGDSLSAEFLSFCQKTFTDLEFTCYVNYDTPNKPILNIAWDELSYTKDKNEINNNTFLAINNNDIKKYPKWLNNNYTKITDDIVLTSEVMIDSLSNSSTSGYPYYIMSSDISTDEYVNKPLTFNKYIPYDANYLYTINWYEFIPSGKNTSKTIISSWVTSSGVEYINIDNVDISISEYYDNLNNIYINQLSALNNEYNSLSGNIIDKDKFPPNVPTRFEPNSKKRMDEITISTLVTIPNAYNNAMLKLISSEILLSGITLDEITDISNVYIDINATSAVTYTPTGLLTGYTENIITGGNISSTIDYNSVIFPTSIDTTNNQIKLIIDWKNDNDLSKLFNQTINYIYLNSHIYNNYTLISGELDQWRNYYAKQYHDLAVNILMGTTNNHIDEYTYGSYYQCKINAITINETTNAKEIPIPANNNLNTLYNYIGNTTNFYLQNNYYYCKLKDDSTTEYEWYNININNEDSYLSIIDLPEPTESLQGVIYKYISNYIPHSYYQCIAIYEEISTKLPTASITNLNKIYKYVGTSNEYILNHFYICEVNENDEYIWQDTTTQFWFNPYKWQLINNIYIDNTVNEMPEAEEALNDKIYLYLGNSTDNYKPHNYYQCIQNEYIESSTIPVAAATYLNKIYKYTNNTTATYIQDNYYKCVLNANNQYVWQNITGDFKEYEWQNIGMESIYMPMPSEDLKNKIYMYDGNLFNVNKNQLYQCNIKYYETYIDILPTPNKELFNKIYKYTGSTIDYQSYHYENNHYYICIYNDYNISYTPLPIPSNNYINKIYKYLGETTTKYIQNNYYKCILNEESNIYEWLNISTNDELLYIWKDITESNDLYEWKNITTNNTIYIWEKLSEDYEPQPGEIIIEKEQLPITDLYNELNKIYKYVGTNTKHIETRSTYPLYQYFSTVLSSNVENILNSSSVATFNLNKDLNGLYTMAEEINVGSKTKYNSGYNVNKLYLYKLLSAYDNSSSVATHNYVFNDVSDGRYAYVYYGINSSGNSSSGLKYDIYNPVVSSSFPSVNSNVFNNIRMIKYVGVTNNSRTQTCVYECYKSNNTYYWSTATHKGSQYEGKYTICIENAANEYQYIECSIMPTINYKSALIILNYLCKQQNWKLTFKYYNHYYQDGKWKNLNGTEKYVVTNLIKELNTNNIYSIVKLAKRCNSGTSSAFNVYCYNSTFNNSTLTNVIHDNDFEIEISK